MEIANMTLEQLSRVTQMLGQARMSAYMHKVGGQTYLYAVKESEYAGALDPVSSIDAI